jgi:Protein of unknown function (DUF3168)
MATAWDLQQALVARLEPVLAGLSPPIPIYADAGPETPKPFCELARHIFTPDDGFDHYLTQDLVTFSVYSEHGGQKQVLQAMEAMRAALADARLPLGDTEETIRCRYERMDTGVDADGRTHVGSIIFSILFRH